LIAFAKDPNGLAAKLERDRRGELLSLEHGRNAQIVFRAANVLSFGRYVHREERTIDMESRLDIARRLSYHTTFLRQVAKSGIQVEVAWNIEDICRSLNFIAEHGAEAGEHAVLAAAHIFARTKDDEVRRACLESLSRISSSKAKTELLRISENQSLEQRWRDTAASALRQVNVPAQPIASSVIGGALKGGQP